MTQLLVSVRSAQEARDALAGGAAIIDVKEPSRGSLGRADSSVWREVATAVRGRVPVSAALGELTEFELQRGGAAEVLQFAKVGLAGCAAMADWRERWATVVRSLPDGVFPVAVSYADWRNVEAPPPQKVIEAGRALGCAAWLMDTCDKQSGRLLSHVTLDELAGLIDLARARELKTVLAGSLTSEMIRRLLPLEPDYIAVRGAACSGCREGAIDRDRVGRLAALLDDGKKN